MKEMIFERRRLIMSNRLLFVLCLLAFGAIALCDGRGNLGESSVPGPAAVIPFLGGLLMNLKRKRK